MPGDFGYLGLFGGRTAAPMMAKYPGVKPLIDDTEEITRYTEKTGINPMIHVIALTQAIVGRHPDLPAKLTWTFREARDAAAPYMDADEIAGNAKEREVLGEDPYAYVFGEDEKRTWAALNRYQIEQALLKTMLPLEELFVGHVKRCKASYTQQSAQVEKDAIRPSSSGVVLTPGGMLKPLAGALISSAVHRA